MSHPDRFAPSGGVSRNAMIVGSVVALHVAGLWALQSGLLRKAAEVIVPAELLSEFIAPPAPPKITPPPPAPPPPPKPAPKAAPRPAPMPVAIRDPAPAPSAPVGISEPQPPAPPIEAPMAPPAPAPAPPAPPAPPKIELPSSDAAYLNNPKPSYPAISKRMGEQGKVVLRVEVDACGKASNVRVLSSTPAGVFDAASVAAAKGWTFKPARRNGTAVASALKIPMTFELNASGPAQ